MSTPTPAEKNGRAAADLLRVAVELLAMRQPRPTNRSIMVAASSHPDHSAQSNAHGLLRGERAKTPHTSIAMPSIDREGCGIDPGIFSGRHIPTSDRLGRLRVTPKFLGSVSLTREVVSGDPHAVRPNAPQSDQKDVRCSDGHRLRVRGRSLWSVSG